MKQAWDCTTGITMCNESDRNEVREAVLTMWQPARLEQDQGVGCQTLTLAWEGKSNSKVGHECSDSESCHHHAVTDLGFKTCLEYH